MEGSKYRDGSWVLEVAKEKSENQEQESMFDFDNF